MIKLYYSPFSCSMAIDIALKMSWADYESEAVQIGSDEFKKINPSGAVPAMVDWDSEVMTQVPALLHYINSKFEMWMWSDWTPEWDYKLNNLLCFVNSDLHTAFGGWFAPNKMITKTDEESIESVKQAAFTRIENKLSLLNDMLEWKKYLMWDRMTIVDLYAFVVSNWANFMLPSKLDKFPNIVDFQENMIKNDSVKEIIQKHKEKNS